jgi:DNA anti-recombination protein RmuC
MKSSIRRSYVSESTFKKEAARTRTEFKKVHQEFGKVHQRIDNVQVSLKNVNESLGQAIVKTQMRLERVEQNMMTRDAGDQILSQLQDLAKKYENAEASARIHLNQVMDFRPRLEDHENRLVALEKRPPLIKRQ